MRLTGNGRRPKPDRPGEGERARGTPPHSPSLPPTLLAFLVPLAPYSPADWGPRVGDGGQIIIRLFMVTLLLIKALREVGGSEVWKMERMWGGGGGGEHTEGKDAKTREREGG